MIILFSLSSVKEVKRKLEKVLKSKKTLSKSIEIFGKQRLTDQRNEELWTTSILRMNEEYILRNPDFQYQEGAETVLKVILD